MTIETVRNAVIAQLAGDTDLVAVFGSDIDYGLGRKMPDSTRAIRVSMDNPARDEDEEEDFGDGDVTIYAAFNFLVAAIFKITPESETSKDVEDYSSDFDRLMRKALADKSAGGIVSDIILGRTFITALPEKNQHFVVVEIKVKAFEGAATR